MPFDLEPGLLEQTVEHAPGEGAVRPAALERQVDENRSAVNRLGCVSRHVVNLERRTA